MKVDAFGFKPFQHRHRPVSNVNKIHDETLTLGDQVADTFADVVGSWRFIIIQTAILIAWIILNITAWIRHWDPYPFILLNLALSFQAAYAAPIIMMSQNRQTDKDRLQAQLDYEINLKAEEEIGHIMSQLEAQNKALIYIIERLGEMDVKKEDSP